jgi:hypothetical protein
MAHIKYNPETAGAMTLQEAINDLRSAIEKMDRLAALCGAVGNIGGSWDPNNFLGANNNVFDVATDQGQAFNDQIVSINTGLQTFWDATMQGRVADLDLGQ